MRIKEIRYGYAIVGFTADDCRLLARACDEAVNHLISIEQAQDAAHIETLGAAFHAAAIAGLAQLEMTFGDLRKLQSRLKDLGINPHTNN